jgi:hypothetical protein
MIKIKVPRTYAVERDYILSVMFREFLGLDIQVQLSDSQDTRIYMDDDDRELVVSDGLFATPLDQWLQPGSLPKQPLPVWNITNTGLSATTVSPEIPVIYGDEPNHSDFFQLKENKIYLRVDIFGSAFFMLTRYEEVVKPERDKHDRFPATASLAYQENFLDRPIINEYLEILWAYLKKLWPRLQRKIHQSKTLVSCDVDNPYSFYVKSWRKTARKTIGDFFKRKSVSEAIQTLQNTWFSQLGNFSHDPVNTFDWIMGVNEKIGNKVAFYFLVDKTVPSMDGHYDINEPRIRSLIRHIYRRGHEIGLHGSYGTYKNHTQLIKEANILRHILAEEKIEQNDLGSRQHYLRWSSPETARYLNIAGFDYDTTLGYADHAGFRCGTSYEYSLFDLVEQKQLRIRERPLIVMDCSVIDEKYMGLGISATALNTMTSLRDASYRFGGNFTLLWHNSYFQQADSLMLYSQLIQ